MHWVHSTARSTVELITIMADVQIQIKCVCQRTDVSYLLPSTLTPSIQSPNVIVSNVLQILTPVSLESRVSLLDLMQDISIHKRGQAQSQDSRIEEVKNLLAPTRLLECRWELVLASVLYGKGGVMHDRMYACIWSSIRVWISKESSTESVSMIPL
jgi:hypothetical protein